MNLTSTYRDGVNVITVNDSRIDAMVAIQFKDTMRSITETGPQDVLLDLSRVDFIDSSGLGAIVAALKQLGEGRQMRLAGLTGNVAKVFRLTRMDKVFEIVEGPADTSGRAAG
ncbi:STAS domain-containing protein [Roseovarius salinarum]|uniref:STAS domain-containing protein n=1 Tax=Roseovarius salinarum TaxID=1981892 RepID=UPI000C326D03|nr:STAS domain-containing protein [Roseovarius salinarum]